VITHFLKTPLPIIMITDQEFTRLIILLQRSPWLRKVPDIGSASTCCTFVYYQELKVSDIDSASTCCTFFYYQEFKVSDIGSASTCCTLVLHLIISPAFRWSYVLQIA
jgi:hypothetical protein